LIVGQVTRKTYTKPKTRHRHGGVGGAATRARSRVLCDDEFGTEGNLEPAPGVVDTHSHGTVGKVDELIGHDVAQADHVEVLGSGYESHGELPNRRDIARNGSTRAFLVLNPNSSMSAERA
jgi:hypothetical protein